MIIKIEDAPKIKKISINIDFEDGDNTVISSNQNEFSFDRGTNTNDIPLDLDGDFGTVLRDIVEKPNIDTSERKPKVAEGMQNMEI